MKRKINALAPIVGLSLMAWVTPIQAQPDPNASASPSPAAASPAAPAAPVGSPTQPGALPSSATPDPNGFAIGTTGQDRPAAVAAAGVQGINAPNIDGVRPEDATTALQLNEGAPRVSDRAQNPAAPFQTNGWFLDQNGNRVPINGSDPTVNAPPFINPGSLKVTNEGIIPPPPKIPPEIPGQPSPPKKETAEIIGKQGEDEVDQKDPEQTPEEPKQTAEVPGDQTGDDPEKDGEEDQSDKPAEPGDTEPEEPTTVAAEANFVVLDMTAPNVSLLVKEPFSALESSAAVEEDEANLDAEPGKKTHALSYEGPHFFEKIARGETPDPDEDRIESTVVSEEPYVLTEQMIKDVDIPTSTVVVNSDPLYLAVNVPYEFQIDPSDNFEDETNTLKSVVRLNTNNDSGVQFELNPDGISGTVKFLASNFDPDAASDDSASQPSDSDADQADSGDQAEEGTQAELLEGDESADGSADQPADAGSTETASTDASDSADDGDAPQAASDSDDATADAISYAFKIEVEDRRGNKMTLTVPVKVYQRGIDVQVLGTSE